MPPLTPDVIASQAENVMFLELDVSPPAIFEMEFSHDQEQDPRALHMERLMRLDSFLERPSTSKVRKSRSWSVPLWSEGAVDLGRGPHGLAEVDEGLGSTQLGCGRGREDVTLRVPCFPPLPLHPPPHPCRCQSPQRPPPSATHASMASAPLHPATAVDHE